MKSITTTKNSGLTLIEVLVAMSIFAVVISVAVGVFVSGSSSQKKILEFNTTQREASYLMETVSRELRMATAIDISQQNNNNSSIEFTNYENPPRMVKYCRSVADGSCTDDDTGDYFARDGEVINSPDVKIERLRFYVTDDFNQTQPIITVSMKVKSVNQSGAEFVLQNSISMRLY